MSMARSITVIALLAALAGAACDRTAMDHREEGSAPVRLQPLASPPSGDRVARTVYVPVYSSLYIGRGRGNPTVELTATVSVRNVSRRHAIVVSSVRYYDSTGQKVRDHLTQAGQLGPLASVEFVVPVADTVGGPGASFLIDWNGPAGVQEPLVEAVMTGQSGSAGISFTSVGRTLDPDR